MMTQAGQLLNTWYVEKNASSLILIEDLEPLYPSPEKNEESFQHTVAQTATRN